MIINPSCVVLDGKEIGTGIESFLGCPSISFDLEKFKDFNFKMLIKDKYLKVDY